MPNIQVKFKDRPELNLSIEDTSVGRKFTKLIEATYRRHPTIYRDVLKYTPEYMRELSQQAKQEFGWTWDEHEDINIGIAPSLHKNLETLLATGFSQITEQQDELIHELHYCLHLTQFGTQDRTSWLQLEYHLPVGFPLNPDFKFKRSFDFGDVKLINPYVGHGPLQLFQEQDGINISQTCKFHNFIKAGINIAQTDYPEFTDFEALIKFFWAHDPDFVEEHGVEKIIHYTGYPVVGRVTNLNDLHAVVNSGILEFESLSFND